MLLTVVEAPESVVVDKSVKPPELPALRATHADPE
jgi:hypothetical protein